MKRAQRQLEFLEIQEGYIKDEMKNLKREMIRAKEVRGVCVGVLVVRGSGSGVACACVCVWWRR